MSQHPGRRPSGMWPEHQQGGGRGHIHAKSPEQLSVPPRGCAVAASVRLAPPAGGGVYHPPGDAASYCRRMYASICWQIIPRGGEVQINSLTGQTRRLGWLCQNDGLPPGVVHMCGLRWSSFRLLIPQSHSRYLPRWSGENSFNSHRCDKATTASVSLLGTKGITETSSNDLSGASATICNATNVHS